VTGNDGSHPRAPRDGMLLRDVLAQLAHRESMVWVRDRASRQWQVRVLGLEYQSRMLFWRPDGPLYARAREAMAATAGAEPLAWNGITHGGAWVRFDAILQHSVSFPDGSVLMISPFPAEILGDTGY